MPTSMGILLVVFVFFFQWRIVIKDALCPNMGKLEKEKLVKFSHSHGRVFFVNEKTDDTV